MQKTYKKSLGMIVLLMLATSSLSANYSFAESNHSQELSTPTEKIENCQKNGLRTILTEKIVDGKLEVQQYALPDIITEEDLQRVIQLDSQTSNWAYLCNAYNSGIVLFDGKASKLGDSFWKISSEFLNSELSEWKVEDDNHLISQKQSVQDYYFEIIFSVNTGEIQENELFMPLNLELKPHVQQIENCILTEGFDNESINQKIQMEKSI